MQVEMDYGRNGLIIDVPDNADVFLVRETTPVPDENAAILAALNYPIDSPPLRALVQGGIRVTIVHTDITRATPNKRLLPIILQDLEAKGIKKQDITFLNALGTHRAQTQQELHEMLGENIVNQYRCLQHDASDESQLVSLGRSSFGHPIQVNRALLESDLNILTGFIEPHFFAGYSGGPKAVLPGAAGKESIFGNHSPAMMAHPNAAFNITKGNPIWEEMKEAALKVENTFLVNVTLDRTNRINGVFAGDVISAHAQGCQFVEKSSLFTIDKPYDIVITSNSGYPLDQNLYQCVKGLAAARNGVRQGGAILLLAACEEGLPNHGNYARLLNEGGSPKGLLEQVSQPGFVCQDSWQAQIQAQVQLYTDVYLYSDGLSDAHIKTSMLKPCRDLAKTIDKLISTYGSRIGVLPQGPLTILQK
jgi:nickel-dependent lactate racemase